MIETNESWHAELSSGGAEWHVLDESRNTVALIPRANHMAEEDAHLMAAAPQLRERLLVLLQWIEACPTAAVSAIPRAVLENAGQAVQDSRAPL